MASRYFIGIDEVGRGCLAGPVTVAAVAIPKEYRIQNLGYRLGKLRDSKKLTAKQREEWYEYIKNHPKIFHARANVYPKIIDRINVSNAANLAAVRALEKLLVRHKLHVTHCKVFLDGGLFLRPLNSKSNILNSRTVVKADEKFNAVKLASIVAKIGRDRIMKHHHADFPMYGFDKHVGYATKIHRAAVKKHGICELHRLSFCKNFI